MKARLEMDKEVMKAEMSVLGASTLQKSRGRGHEGISPTTSAASSARQNPALCRVRKLPAESSRLQASTEHCPPWLMEQASPSLKIRTICTPPAY